MNRLVDEKPADETLACAADLVRGYQPPGPSMQDYHRVRAQLAVRALAQPPRWPLAFAMVLLLLALNAVAWRLWTAQPAASDRRVASGELVTSRSVPPPASSAPAAVVPSVLPAPPDEMKGPTPAVAPRVRASSSYHAPPDDILDAPKLRSAMQALRRDHDPKQAERLLSRYRAQHPASPLSEEALALAIEAAAARDRVAARALAAEYLQRFPHGRFVDLAKGAQALSRPSGQVR